MSIDIILVGENGWVDQQEQLDAHFRGKAYGFVRRWWTGVTYYHRNGYRYRVATVRPNRPLGLVARVLASTIYNPQIEFAIEYDRGDTYDLSQLRDAVATAIRRDDDILTQFHEPEALLARLDQARSFDDVLAVIEFSRTDPDGSQDLAPDA